MSGPKPIPKEPRWMSRLSREFLESMDQLTPGESPLLVALSGGADSVALTMLLARDSNRQLVLAHFNHGLRGEESDQDSEFVSLLAIKLQRLFPERIRTAFGAPLTPLKHDKGNLEANARKVRYAWLVQTAREFGCPTILTGHHAQDQAETVLFHIIRGTGPQGLKGIAAKKKASKGITLVRPLLEFPPELLRRYLEELGQTFREDSSNQLGLFTRNRLRHEIIPQLSAIMGRPISPNLAGVAWHARNLHKKEMSKLRAWISSHAQFLGPNTVSLPVAELERLGKYSAMGLIGHISKMLNWPRRGLSRIHCRAFWNQIVTKGRTVALPGGITSCLDASGKNLTLRYFPTGS